MTDNKKPDIEITNIKVTCDFLSRVLETAVEAGHTHGIGYWADVTKIKEHKTSSDHDARFVSLSITDRDTNKTYVVNHGDVTIGILAALRHGHTQVLKTDDLDGPTADIIVQCACFQEVLYG